MNIQEMQMSPFLFMKASFLSLEKRSNKMSIKVDVNSMSTLWQLFHDFHESKADCKF